MRHRNIGKGKIMSVAKAAVIEFFESKPTHGGHRPNAGAKKKAVKAVSRSVSMLPDEWARLDRMRGELSRGKFISSLLDGH